MHLQSLYPSHLSGRGLSHIIMSVCRAMNVGDLKVTLTVPAASDTCRAPFVREAVPRALRWASYRLLKDSRERTQRRFLRGLKRDDAAYLWPGLDVQVYEQVKRQGIVIANERINTHQATSKRILDAEYARLGWPVGHDITDEFVRHERRILELSDFIFAPSPLVADSLVEEGVDPTKVIATSYGWDPARFGGSARALEPIDGMTVLFVGLICVRKGAHLLLKAWRASGVKGRLVLAGKMTDEIATHCAEDLNRDDVIHLGHVGDIASVYRSADVFAFPSLEEGSPLVAYEAMASRLAMLVSPMGAGGVVEDGLHGRVINPHDLEGWIAALRSLEADAALRGSYGQAARERAEHFTWEKVGIRRAEALLSRVGVEIAS